MRLVEPCGADLFAFCPCAIRDIVAAALAVALLGSRVTERCDLGAWLPMPVGELDSYPFSAAFRPAVRHRLINVHKLIEKWPPNIKKRALSAT